LLEKQDWGKLNFKKLNFSETFVVISINGKTLVEFENKSMYFNKHFPAKYPEIVLQAGRAVLFVHNIIVVREEITSRNKQQQAYSCIYFLHIPRFLLTLQHIYHL